MGGIYGEENLFNSIPLMPRDLQQMMLSSDQNISLDFGDHFMGAAAGGNQIGRQNPKIEQMNSVIL